MRLMTTVAWALVTAAIGKIMTLMRKAVGAERECDDERCEAESVELMMHKLEVPLFVPEAKALVGATTGEA